MKDIKTVKISDIIAYSDVPDDECFTELFTKALKGELLCHVALIKMEGIKPYSDYKPDITEADIRNFEVSVQEGKPALIHVYPQNDTFIMSDDYVSYYLRKEQGATEVMCLVLGEATGQYVIEKGKPFILPLPKTT